MADNQLVITAGLNIPETVSLIQDQLNKRVAPALHLNIVCGIDTKNIENVKKQISNITPTIDAKRITNDVIKEFNTAFGMIGKVGEQSKKEFNRQTKQMLQEFKAAWKEGTETGDFSAYEKALDNLQQRVSEFNRGDVQQLKNNIAEIRRQFTDGSKVSIGNNLKGWLDYATGSKGLSKEYLDAVYGAGNYTVSKGNAGYDTLLQRDDDAVEGIINAAKKIIEYQDKIKSTGWGLDELVEQGENAERVFSAVENKLREIVGLPERSFGDDFVELLSADDLSEGINKTQKNLEAFAKGMEVVNEYKQMYTGEGITTITSDWIKNADDDLTGFTINVTKATGEIEHFKYAIGETNEIDILGSTGSDKGAIAVLQKAIKEADTLERRIISLKAAADDVNTARPIKSEEGIKAVSKAYDKAKTAIEAVRGANNETFLELDNEAKKAVDNLSNVIKAQRNLETAATKLRAKPIEIIKKEELSDLNAFIATMSNSAIPDITILTEKAEQLRTELSNVGENDKQGLADYLDNFSNLQAEFKAVNTQAKIVKQTIAELDKLLGNVQFANNRSNPEVVSNVADINALKANLQEIYAEIGRIDSPEALQTVTNKLSALKATTDNVVGSAKQLQTTLKNTAHDDALSAKINKLAADMKNFAIANERATKSQRLMSDGMMFADKWSELMSRMAKGADLTETEVRELRNELILFGKAAQAEGLKGASAFEKFGNAFKLISTYMSANRLIGIITSKIREAVTELQTLDDILTEISKTSNRTEESLRELGNTAFDTASKYGRTASDYLLGVQEMSRAGFGERESEALAELSLRAQAAGDMTAEMANEYIIATNAAYKLDGNIDKLNKVLDSQNYITNHNALNMENLAEATKLAASQAANAGVESDQLTAAIGTMVAVTQQGGAQAGRAFRGILMNLQQVKATATEIGDDGEDITSSSLSKYEKAVAALGVSMKQIKNGVISLRNPMEILRDLAAAVSKESKDSIKVANLLSSVGGKYRAK